MTYIKAVVSALALIICISLIYNLSKVKSENQSNLAIESFQKGDFAQTEQALSKIKELIPPEKYHLYQAYVAREKKQMELSDHELKLAEEDSRKHRNTSLLYEISLNEALNAYLEKNHQALKQALSQATEIAGANDDWIRFFNAIQYYQEQKYEQALEIWLAPYHPLPLSPWMQKAFDGIFTPFWKTDHIARANIKLGKYIAARQNLELESKTASPQKLEDIYFLLGLSYIQEAKEKPLNVATPTYKLAFSYLDQIPIKSEKFTEERQQLIELFRQNITNLIDQRNYTDLPFYLSALESLQGKGENRELNRKIMSLLSQEIALSHFKQVEQLTGLLEKNLKGEELRQSLEKKFVNLIEESLNEENFDHIEQFWQAAVYFSSNPEALKQTMSESTEKIAFENVEKSENAQVIQPYLTFLDLINQDSQSKETLALKLVAFAETLWKQGQAPSKVIDVMKLAESLPSTSPQQREVHAAIERAFINLYMKSVQTADMDQLTNILDAVKQLNLTNVDAHNKREAQSQIEKANQYFASKQFDEALKKAGWILIIDPKNQDALKIVGQIEFQNGNYKEALAHLKAIEHPEVETSEALAISQILVGDSKQGNQLLETLISSKKASKDVYLKLGFGALIVGQSRQALMALDKVKGSNDEVLSGLTYAYFTLPEWKETTQLYAKLRNPYKNLWGLKSATAIAYVNLGESEKAQKLLAQLQEEQPKDESFSLIFQTFMKKVLNQLEPNYAIGVYEKVINKDPAQALSYFLKIEKPAPQIRLEIAETYLTLGKQNEALSSLVRLLADVKDQSQYTEIKTKALSQLANLYFARTLYPEAVATFEEILKEKPLQPDQRDLYAQALQKIRRWDLALKQYDAKEENGSKAVARIASLVHIGQFSEANVQATETLKKEKNLTNADRLKLADLLLITKDQKLFEKATQNLPESKSLSDLEAEIKLALDLGDYAKAESLVQKNKKELEDHVSGLMLMAQLQRSLSKLRESLEFAYKAHQMEHYNLEVLDFLSNNEYREDYFKRSLDRFRKLIEAYPEDPSWTLAYVRNLIADALVVRSSSQLAGGLEAINQLLAKRKDLPEAYFLAGQLHYLQNENDEAIKFYKTALDLDKSYSEAYKYLALIELDLGNKEAARGFLEKALVYSPNDAEAWEELSIIQQDEGNFIDALSSLQKSIHFRPNNSSLYVEQAKLSMDVNNPEDARAALDTALTLDPRNPQALRLMLIILYDPDLDNDQKLLEKRKEIFHAYHEINPQDAEIIQHQLSTESIEN